jgi:hypothetical protein
MGRIVISGPFRSLFLIIRRDSVSLQFTSRRLHTDCVRRANHTPSTALPGTVDSERPGTSPPGLFISTAALFPPPAPAPRSEGEVRPLLLQFHISLDSIPNRLYHVFIPYNELLAEFELIACETITCNFMAWTRLGNRLFFTVSLQQITNEHYLMKRGNHR